MKLACVRALAELARAEQSDVVAAAYGTRELRFGPDYLIPRPFDPRLITKVAPAVAEAAMASGVATRPLEDLDAYRRSLQRYVYTSGTVMQPVFAAAAEGGTRRVVYAEGEDERVLQAAQVAVDENIARPVLVGRPDVIGPGSGTSASASRPGATSRWRASTTSRLSRVRSRLLPARPARGVERDAAAAEMRRNGTLIGAMLLREGEADAMLCGTFGRYRDHLRYIAEVSACARGRALRGMNLLHAAAAHALPLRHLRQPRSDGRADRRDGAARRRRDAALRAHAEGWRSCRTRTSAAARTPTAAKMREALALINESDPDLEVDGEMQATRRSPRTSGAGLPELAAQGRREPAHHADARCGQHLVQPAQGGRGAGIPSGPILLGAAKPAHILTPTGTVRRIINMTALAAVGAT